MISKSMVPGEGNAVEALRVADFLGFSAVCVASVSPWRVTGKPPSDRVGKVSKN